MRRLIRRMVPLDVRVILSALVRLPPRIAWFYIRAHVTARRKGDAFALAAPTRPRDLSRILKLAAGRRQIVELGTGTAWTALALVIADSDREVITYDIARRDLSPYLSLVAAQQRERLLQREARAESGPSPGDPPVHFLFIDIGGHARADTANAFLAWRDALAPGATAVFHDYGPRFPGVPMAVAQLGLEGQTTGESLFVWHAPR